MNLPPDYPLISDQELEELEDAYAEAEAAMTAAYYSRGRGSSRIAVDYTPVKNLHKPRGTRPGFVTYSHQKTVFVSPDKEKVEKLLVF